MISRMTSGVHPSLDFTNDQRAYEKRENSGLWIFAVTPHHLRSVAELARKMAHECDDPLRETRTPLKILEVSSHVPAHPPRTFWGSAQMYWYVHIGVILEANTWIPLTREGLTSTYIPSTRREIEEGTLTREDARELLQCFWVKFNNQPHRLR